MAGGRKKKVGSREQAFLKEFNVRRDIKSAKPKWITADLKRKKGRGERRTSVFEIDAQNVAELLKQVTRTSRPLSETRFNIKLRNKHMDITKRYDSTVEGQKEAERYWGLVQQEACSLFCERVKEEGKRKKKK